MSEHPILTEKHLDIIKQALLKNHPKTQEDFEKEHDIDFGYVAEKNNISFRVNGFRSLGRQVFLFEE